jgi:hypothetical protein
MDKTFHCNSEGVNLSVESLNSIFDLSASLSNQKCSIRQPKKIKNNEKWFDEECKNLRKKLGNLANQKQQEHQCALFRVPCSVQYCIYRLRMRS